MKDEHIVQRVVIATSNNLRLSSYLSDKTISLAVAASPAAMRAPLRHSRVAKLVLPRLSPGAHWSHSASIALSQLFGAVDERFGFDSMFNICPGEKPKYSPISLHLDACSVSCLSRER